MIPKLRWPLEPILEHVRCKLGISEDEYMEVSPCDPPFCSALEILQWPNRYPSGNNRRLFPRYDKLQYGARALIKVLDDESCEDPRLHEICKSLFEEDKVIMEEACSTPR